MRNILTVAIASILFFIPKLNYAQGSVDEDQLGAWYMYFWNVDFDESSFGLQGDVQYRNWNLLGDLEQLLLRGGITYRTKNSDAKFTLGYGNITTGEFGESSRTTSESRIYQEALLPQKIESRFYITHRFRYEQRFVEDQDFRTRFRYALFLNVPLNEKSLTKGALYLALYNEVFLNGERMIGDSREVDIFDRNRLYTALGYVISDHLRCQLGFMEQTTNQLSKSQIQVSFHQNF